MKYIVRFTQDHEYVEVGTFDSVEKAVKYGNDNSCEGVSFEVKVVNW